jgi:hypothetical protein
MPPTPRDHDAHGLAGLPPWAQATLKLGATTVIAIYLVWFTTSKIESKLDAHAHESRDGIARQVQLLSQICQNTASTPEERAACWR